MDRPQLFELHALSSLPFYVKQTLSHQRQLLPAHLVLQMEYLRLILHQKNLKRNLSKHPFLSVQQISEWCSSKF